MGQTTSQTAPAHLQASFQSPVDHSFNTSTESLAQCPVQHNETPAAQCPVHVNPSNQMPTLSQAASPSQRIPLPIERTVSSIPRPNAQDDATATRNWFYPSPQQFYNALVRKGWETPEEHVETMVEIHNFLNEKAWEEVLRWENRRDGVKSPESPELSRFIGRPGVMSPKARFWLLAGWLLPSKFNTEPPFDRHDWVIRRPSTKEEVRYIIDYYSAPPEPDGSPVFSLDVRPALDSWGSVKDRIRAATDDTWKSFKEKESSNSKQQQ